jgi:CheY-like chemotaxis protein
MIRCLLIDDNEAEHNIFALALKTTGLNAVCHYFLFADEAFDALYREDIPLPNIIFLDLNIPRLSGVEFLEKLKHTGRLKHIPVFVYTMMADEKNIEEALEHGAVGVVIKPGTYKELADLLLKKLKSYIADKPN